jgi:hypothetical protein
MTPRASDTSGWPPSTTRTPSPIRRYPTSLHRLLRGPSGRPDGGGPARRARDDSERSAAPTGPSEASAVEEGASWPGRLATRTRVLTGVARFGLFIELIDHYVRAGHVSSMGDDYYRFLGSIAARREYKRCIAWATRSGYVYVDMERRQVELDSSNCSEAVRQDTRPGPTQQDETETRTAQGPAAGAREQSDEGAGRPGGAAGTSRPPYPPP